MMHAFTTHNYSIKYSLTYALLPLEWLEQTPMTVVMKPVKRQEKCLLIFTVCVSFIIHHLRLGFFVDDIRCTCILCSQIMQLLSRDVLNEARAENYLEKRLGSRL